MNQRRAKEMPGYGNISAAPLLGDAKQEHGFTMGDRLQRSSSNVEGGRNPPSLDIQLTQLAEVEDQCSFGSVAVTKQREYHSTMNKPPSSSTCTRLHYTRALKHTPRTGLLATTKISYYSNI